MGIARDDPEGSQGNRLGLVTVGITVFRRPKALRRLEESIRRYYPEVPTVVVDTESNLSRGRNQLVRAVSTPFLLLCEEDFEFSDRTRIEDLLEVLDHDPEIEGVGGELLEPRGRACWAHNFRRRGEEIVASPSDDPIRRTPAGIDYQPCQLIYNFGLFRRDLFIRVDWDEGMPLNEHLDYYWRVSLIHRRCMAVARGIAIHHHKDRPSDEYVRFRGRDFTTLVDVKHNAHFRAEQHYGWPDCSIVG